MRCLNKMNISKLTSMMMVLVSVRDGKKSFAVYATTITVIDPGKLAGAS